MEVTVALSSERVFLAVKISRTLLFLGFLVGVGRALSDPFTDELRWVLGRLCESVEALGSAVVYSAGLCSSRPLFGSW
jgi:hypothetical protein